MSIYEISYYVHVGQDTPRTLIVVPTCAGILSRFALKVSKPSCLKVNVRYWSGGPAGIANVNPMAYIGQRSKSQILFHNNFSVMACLLCISPLLGSSRRMRLTMIFSSRSVNQPLGRHQLLVCVGEGAIMKTDQIPMISVRMPSSRKSHLQPSYP